MRPFWLGVLVGTALLPLLGLAIVLVGWSPIQATADPPRWETVLGRTALASAVARQAPRIRNPLAPTSENLRAGMKLFLDDCAGCHGDGAKRSRWGTTMFYPRVPQLGMNPTNKPDWQVFWIIQHGVRYSGMAGNGGLLADNEIWKVATFLTNLNSLPPDVEQQWRGLQSGK